MAEEILRMRKVNKYFPGVHALKDVDFSCVKGEVHALIGHNGAGKTTLMKVLGGAYYADSGEIFLRKRPFNPINPIGGLLAGISIIYQEFNLIPDLNVAQNIYLGREIRTRLGFIDYRSINEETENILNRLGVENVRATDYVRDLYVNQLQLVEIAKALSIKADIIVMDEPTAALPLPDVEKLFETIKNLKSEDITIIYISHRIEDIFKVADRVTLMKDGSMLDTLSVSGLDHNTLVEKMTGRSIADIFPIRHSAKKDIKTALLVQDFKTVCMNKPITFKVNEGEILGFTGLEGCGATEVVRGLFGVEALKRGKIILYGEELKINSPRDALFSGFGLLTKDRHEEGLVLGLSLIENISIPLRIKHRRFGLINLKEELEQVKNLVNKLNIRAGDLTVEANNLSGGNQQKVVLAKWLATECRVLMVDEPTRGIDVESKIEIYYLMRTLVAHGVIVVVVSSDMEETIGLFDRVIVLHRGEIKANLNWEKVNENKILLAATGCKLDKNGSPIEKINRKNLIGME